MSSQNPGCITSQTGHTIKLFCHASDCEITVFKWTKGGRVVSNGSTSGVLNVPISSSDDFGVYTCHAMNKHGVTSYNITVCQNTDHVGVAAPEGIRFLKLSLTSIRNVERSSQLLCRMKMFLPLNNIFNCIYPKPLI